MSFEHGQLRPLSKYIGGGTVLYLGWLYRGARAIFINYFNIHDPRTSANSNKVCDGVEEPAATAARRFFAIPSMCQVLLFIVK